MLYLLTLGRLAVEPQAEVAGGAPRPRRLALLAILAAAGPRAVTRDRVLAVLWPESNADRGRHALSQTLYSLRRDLGTDVVKAGPIELRLDPERIRTDLGELRDAIAAKQWEDVVRLYVGPFADGFYLSEDSGFGEWVEDERRRIAAEAQAALEAGALEAQAAGKLGLARQCWTRLTLADPLSGRFAHGLMATLYALGDKAGALAHARVHAAVVKRELEVEPDGPVLELMATLRNTA